MVLPSWLGGHCIPLEHWHWTLIKSHLLFRQLRKVGKFQLLDNITNIIVRESHFLSFNCFGCSVLSILRESHSFLGDPHFLKPHLVRPVQVKCCMATWRHWKISSQQPKNNWRLMPWMRSSLEWFKERTVSFLWENT